MVETAKLFWNRSKEWYSAMADKLTDIVYTDDSKETINVINLLLLGWILLGLVVYIIGNVIATYLRKKKSLVCSGSKPETPSSADDTGPCANDIPKSEDILEAPQQTIIPTCEGDDEEFSKWINSVISWIYTQRVVSPIIDSWLTALNARTRLSSTEHGILVDFRDLLHTSGPPKVTEVRQNAYSKYDNTGVSCDMEFENIAFEMVVTQFKEKEKVLLPFVLQVKRLAGKVGVECSPEDVSFVAKYSEPPQIDLYPEVSNDTEVPEEDYGPLCDIVAEISNDALTNVIVPLRLSCFPDCPRMHTPHNTPQDVFEIAESSNERRLLVKVIKATQLGGTKGCVRPFCVVEMDDPPQRFETQVVEGTTSPFWDEGFTFSVKDPAELLFEIYDKDEATSDGEGGFLGLGLVGVEELVRNPSQRQIIPLQSRPLQEDDVTGALTVEFLFLDRTSPVLEATRFGPPLKETPGKTVETNSRVTAGGTVITTTTIKRTQEECSAITTEPTPNPKANPNANLHATEEMLHPKTPNASNELAASSLEETVFDQTPHSLSQNEDVDPPESDQRSDIFEPIVEMKLDSVTQNSVLFPNQAYQENPSVVNEGQVVDLHAQIVDKIFESLVQESDRYSYVHADHKVSPSENGDVKLEMHAQIDDHDTDLLVSNKKLDTPVTKEKLELLGDTEKLDSQVSNEMLDQNGYHKQESDVSMENVVLKGTELNNVSAEIAASKGPEHTNGTQNGVVPKTVGITVPVIRPPWLPSILVEGSPPKDESANVEDSSLAGESANEPPIEVEKSVDGENDLAGTALQQLGKQHPAPSKSTLIIHSVQRPDNSVSDSLETSPAHLSNNSSSPPPQDDQQEDENRGRAKEKRSFMGTLRRRLSFHRGRSKSAETPLDQSRASSRSASTDRIRQHPPSTPTSRMSPFKARFLGSTRSSLSEASGISAASAKTYINENSTLVIETNENGIVKRYLIPNSLVHRSKWKKRGTKLHIYNNHVFVAKHLSGSTQCQVCRRHLTRRPGKQGYECRGCDLQCHKSCHVKVDNYCANSSINAMEVEYIHDPKGASPKSI